MDGHTIRLLALDFDGVMTDNRALVDQDGREAVWVHRGDGWGIARLRRAGLPIVVISTETNPVVAARCRKLQIECIQGCESKLATLQAFAEERSIDRRSIAYIGNDVNDLDCLRWVGFPIAVADAEREVRAVAKIRTSKAGGWGAVREVIDWILSSPQGLSRASSR
jgi:YrbI family 3-deoxy-D-manno-octulosonate 8-phosphate phosphatase